MIHSRGRGALVVNLRALDETKSLIVFLVFDEDEKEIIGFNESKYRVWSYIGLMIIIESVYDESMKSVEPIGFTHIFGNAGGLFLF